MADNQSLLNDIIVNSIQEKPLEVQNAFNDLMTNKLSDAIETRKQEIAAGVFGQEFDSSLVKGENPES